MRPLLPLVLFCAAGALFSGCASDLESPFAMTKQEWRKTVIVEVGANDAVRVQGSKVDAYKLADVMRGYALEQPGREVTLLLEEGGDARAADYIRQIAAHSGLGKVTLATKAELKRQAKEKSEAVKPVEKTTVAPSNVTGTPAPRSEWQDAEVAGNPLSAPSTTTLPPPPPPPPPAPPAKPLYDPAVITIELSAGTEFKVNGVPVEYENFGVVLQKLGRENPGKPVSLVAESGVSLRAVSFIHQEAKKAGLGPVAAK